MSKAIGMVEYQSVPSGILAADTLIKTAEVEVMLAQVVCPGKYIVLISGELSAVKAAIEASKIQCGEKLVDSFVLGNPHEAIFPAVYGAAEVGDPNALGVLETFSAASIIVAADSAAKTSQVDLIELRLARGMSGKGYLLLTGEVAAVEAAIDAAKKEVGAGGNYLDSTVIPNPDKKLWQNIL